MQQVLLFALIGLGAGAAYAAIGLGVTVTYQGTGTVHFGLGAAGMWTVYVFDELRRTGDLLLPIPLVRVPLGSPTGTAVALVLAVLSAAAVGWLSQLLVFRPLAAAPVLAKVVASIGIMLTLQALVVLRVGSASRAVAPVLPAGGLHIGDGAVPQDRLWIAALLTVVTVALWAYLRYTRFGLATRAAAENERAASLAGFAPQALAASTAVIAGVVVGIFCILAAPTLGLTTTGFVLMIAPGLACALAGRFDNLFVVLATGLLLGVVQSELTLLRGQEWWPTWASTGLNDAVPFLAIVGGLVLVGRSLPTRGADAAEALPEVVIPQPRWLPITAVIGGAVVLLFVLRGGFRFGLITSFIVALLALSLVVLTGLAGQVSLAQAAFAGSAGFVVAKLAAAHAPLPIALPFAAAVAALLGVLVGLPAVRIRGAQLAVVTLALGIALERFVFRNPSFTDPAGNPIPDPVLFGISFGVSDGLQTARIQFGLLVLVILTVVALGVANLTRSGTGRRLLAIRSDERAAAAVGINVSASKLLAFGIASFIAGIGGALIGYSRGQLTADSFTVFVGLSLLAFAYLGGITSVSGAVVAGLSAPLGLVFVTFSRLFEDLGTWYAVLAGVSLVLGAIFNPVGVAGAATSMLRRFRAAGGHHRPVAPGPPEPPPVAVVGARAHTGKVRLRTTGLSVQYGGLRALDGVDLSVRAGQIIGLIGPNGAGKTTFIDAVTGFTPSTGEVFLEGLSLDGAPPHQRARRGLRRTWQAVQLFADLDAHDNVAVAAQPFDLRTLVLDLVRPQRAPVLAAVGGALARMDLTPLARVRPQTLTLGQRKLLGVARALAMPGSVLLLDEPAAGLSGADRIALAARLRQFAADGLAVLLVEHDVDLVLSVCDHVYVLEFGHLLAHGTPAQIRTDRRVIDAYLGQASRGVEERA
ncbi:branched-chain amino acid ABC transporter permease/ATP-binding protein [Virgisporangium aurantiacum]|uniref:ABC transporter n=1 Tax=Virgisporangium aurantiacum TaxID=175570 RepID=A0A8J3ZKN0_9ACTN|nr:branched-chain amino acid ABC transporter permease/ATP-binding protein [Virgisporangium aurantiacum]GIJ63200.1 ABC transporter [Virgisporangium aurantiacum]